MDLTQAINRLDKHVEDFFTNKNVTSARKAGEAICKIIIFDRNNTINTTGKFEQLISSLTPKNIKLPRFFLSKIQAELRVLQSYGNADSHDSDEVLNTSDLSRIQRAISSLLSYLFDSKDEYNLDHKIPNYIYELINEKNIGNDNWRCQQIISIIYPNRKILINNVEKDYEFYIVEDADSRKVAFLGMNRNISFKEVFDKALHHETLKNINSLTFLFPIEISKTTGLTVKNRKEYIQRTSQNYLSKYPNILCNYDYYDDYIWDKCLPDYIKVNNELDLRKDFIDQNLFDDDNNTHMSLSFVDNIISEIRSNRNPLNIIFGQGGVGKTTFCEQAIQKINSKIVNGTKKKAIYISSIDIQDDIISNVSQINSIEDLYSIIFNNDEDTKIEKESLALNISCGNLVIVIDGLDEIISKLKDKFRLNDFFESIKKLNDTYRGCTIIITSREITLEPIDKETTKLFYLKGFDDNLINKYLIKRFKDKDDLIKLAYKSIKEISSSDKITPLIIRLVSDLTEDSPISRPTSVQSEFLDSEQPLDKVVLLLISREIQKQVLDMNVDQYFSLLQSIVFEHRGKIKESDFCDQVQYILQVTNGGKVYTFTEEFYSSYLVSSLLKRDHGELSIKYDSIEFLVKLRYITHVINSNNKDNTINDILVSDCYRGGVLINEISKYKENETEFEKTRLNELIKLPSTNIHEKKMISAILYIYFSTKRDDRNANMEHLKFLFDGDRIKNIAIFGDFHPIDFTELTIENGFFDNYTGLAKSLLPRNKTIFNNSKFINFSSKDFSKNIIFPENFNSDCDLSDELKKVIDLSIEANVKRKNLIEDDLIKILKVGFKTGTFTWKSLDVYKLQCTSLKTRFSLSQMLNMIEDSGFLVKEESKGAPPFGYKANPEYIHEIKDFITQRIISAKFDRLIKTIELQ